MKFSSNVPTSGLFVTLTMTLAGMIGALALPWTEYQTVLWTQTYPGIHFDPEYPKRLAELATTGFQLLCALVHVCIIGLYRSFRGRNKSIPPANPNPNVPPANPNQNQVLVEPIAGTPVPPPPAPPNYTLDPVTK